ncbi:MAG: hypothetical protein N2A42_12500 [Luteolibacter sp.]
MPFDPLTHNFTLLPTHDPAPGVKFYELKTHPSVTGETDHHRLNIYLSHDKDFVTIWWGALESTFLFSLFGDIEPPDYNEPLFRGYIETDQEASIILKSLHLTSYAPNKIEKTEDGKIICSLLAGGDL